MVTSTPLCGGSAGNAVLSRPRCTNLKRFQLSSSTKVRSGTVGNSLPSSHPKTNLLRTFSQVPADGSEHAIPVSDIGELLPSVSGEQRPLSFTSVEGGEEPAAPGLAAGAAATLNTINAGVGLSGDERAADLDKPLPSVADISPHQAVVAAVEASEVPSLKGDGASRAVKPMSEAVETTVPVDDGGGGLTAADATGLVGIENRAYRDPSSSTSPTINAKQHAPGAVEAPVKESTAADVPPGASVSTASDEVNDDVAVGEEAATARAMDEVRVVGQRTGCVGYQ